MRRFQSILISSVLVTSLLTFSLGWFFGKNIGAGNSGGSGNVTVISQPSGNGTETPASEIRFKNLDEVWEKLRSSYYDTDKLDLEKLAEHAVKGFVYGVGDPYTIFMSPDEAVEFDNGLEGELEGIGAVLDVRNGQLVVENTLRNAPAEKAGMKAGDVIYKINGELAEELSLPDAIKKIRGRKGTRVTLTMLREKTTQPFDLTITRDEIVIENVKLEKKEDGIVLISIDQFNDHTMPEFHTAIQEMLLNKPRGIILDLRDNGGGYLDTSIEVLSEFLEPNSVAVIIKERDTSKNKVMKTQGTPRLGDIPVVVLANKYSASASEIVAGALQDHKRAIIIGETTFGKGSVQEIQPLKDGSVLRLTVAKWFTPKDRTIDEVGITPDREVKISEEDIAAKRDPQMEEAINSFRK